MSDKGKKIGKHQSLDGPVFVNLPNFGVEKIF